MLWCVLCACLLALASGDCGHRPTELINAEQTCNEEVTDSIIEKIQHSAKGWFQKAKEQLGIDKDAKPEPRKCEYYKCLFEKLGMLNQLDLPDMSLVQQWVNNNVDVGNRGELNGQLVNCFKLLATSAINVQNSCETASHLMMCFHSSDKCEVFNFP